MTNPPQTIEEIVKEFKARFVTTYVPTTLMGVEITQLYLEQASNFESFLRTALTRAIEGERERIIKLLPPERKEVLDLEDKGYNDYHREILKVLTLKE